MMQWHGLNLSRPSTVPNRKNWSRIQANVLRNHLNGFLKHNPLFRKQRTASVEILEQRQDQDEAVAWLEFLPPNMEPNPKNWSPTRTNAVKPPEWVSQAQSIGESNLLTGAKARSVENALNIGEQFFAEFETTSTVPARCKCFWLRRS